MKESLDFHGSQDWLAQGAHWSTLHGIAPEREVRLGPMRSPSAMQLQHRVMLRTQSPRDCILPQGPAAPATLHPWSASNIPWHPPRELHFLFGSSRVEGYPALKSIQCRISCDKYRIKLSVKACCDVSSHTGKSTKGHL